VGFWGQIRPREIDDPRLGLRREPRPRTECRLALGGIEPFRPSSLAPGGAELDLEHVLAPVLTRSVYLFIHGVGSRMRLVMLNRLHPLRPLIADGVIIRRTR